MTDRHTLGDYVRSFLTKHTATAAAESQQVDQLAKELEIADDILAAKLATALDDHARRRLNIAQSLHELESRLGRLPMLIEQPPQLATAPRAFANLPQMFLAEQEERNAS